MTSSLILDLVPVLPATVVGYPEPTPLPAPICPTCVGGGGSIENVIIPQLVKALGTTGSVPALEYSYSAPDQTFVVPCSVVPTGVDVVNTCANNPSLCQTIGVVYPQYVQYVYSVPLNSTAKINGKTIAEIIQNPFGTVYNMSPLTGVYAGTIAAKTYPKITSTFIEPFKINPGDFVSDNKVYIVISWTCQMNTPAVQACEFPGSTCDQNYIFQIQVLLNLTADNPFFTRCCASVSISSEERQLFCPTVFSGATTTQECVDLLNNYCTESETANDPVCGCYAEYVENNVVGKNSVLEEWLATKSATFPPGCSASCSTGIAWTATTPLPSCDLTICSADVKNIGGGTINTGTGGVKIVQQCNGNSNGNGNGPPPPTISKTVIIASIAAGAVILVVLIILVIMIL